jgi:hypothetical protein
VNIVVVSVLYKKQRNSYWFIVISTLFKNSENYHFGASAKMSLNSDRSGRGRGRGQEGRGRGGRGHRGRWSQAGRGSQKTSPSQARFKGNCAELAGFVFDCSDYRQADKYVTNMKRIAEYVGAEYKQGGDIRSTIENELLLPIPLPTEPVLVAPATALTTAQTLIFKGQIDQYIKRNAMLQENMQKAYSLILGQCTELLRAKMKQSADWATISVAFDVLGLILRIKAIVFKFDDQKFLPVSLHQAKQNFYSLRQGTISNAEYLEKFNNLVDIASSYDGEILDGAVLEYTRDKLHPGTVPADQNDAEMAIVRETAKELVLATAFVLQCDRRRYGKLLEELENDFTKGHNNYPPDMVKAYQLLNEYKQWRPNSNVPQSEGVAFAQKGDKSEGSPEWAAGKTCYECGKKGHIKPHCPLLKKKKGENNEKDAEEQADNKSESDSKIAAIKKNKDKQKKMKTFMQKMADEDETDDEGFETDLSFCNVTKFKMSKSKLRNMVLLDNQSTADIFCNKKLVSNLRQVDEFMTVSGNGGELSTNWMADLKGYGPVWFDNRAITNIISLKQVLEKPGFKVHYDSENHRGFAMQKPNGKTIYFRMHPDGLHYHDFENREVSFVQTVAQNEKGYSQRQLEKARLAKELYAKVGYPSQQDFKAMVAGGMILNCPVTIRDVEVSHKVYGKSVAALKGKTVRRSPEPVVTDLIEVPKEILEANRSVSLSGDVFFVNKIPFFATISRGLKFTTVENIPTRKMAQLVQATRNVQKLYQLRGFKVEAAMMDGEFDAIRGDLLGAGIKLNITSANEHVPEIERRIRVIKERTRATRHELPFTYIPKLMVVYMVRNATMWLNAFPAKGGVSSTLSPRTVLTGDRFDYNKHCRISFGAYAQVHDEPTPSNSQFARTSGAICLGPAANLQGGYRFLHLTSGKKITRRHWTALPMPKEVIARVDQLGKAEGQPKLLTFYNRKGQLIGDHTDDYDYEIPEENHEIPGVDHEIPGVDPATTGVDMDMNQELPPEEEFGLQDPPHEQFEEEEHLEQMPQEPDPYQTAAAQAQPQQQHAEEPAPEPAVQTVQTGPVSILRRSNRVKTAVTRL